MQITAKMSQCPATCLLEHELSPKEIALLQGTAGSGEKYQIVPDPPGGGSTETVKVRRLGEQCRRDVKIWGKLGTQTSALWLDNLMFVLWRASEIKSGLHVTKKTLFGFIRDMPASEMSGAFEDLGSGAHRKSGAAAVTAHQLLPSCLTFFHGMNPHNAFIQANHGAYTLSCVI
ncbi:hypothetical protein WJX77_008794 [Trebouxia sp. C0004]